MKAQKGIRIYRNAVDTDPIYAELKVSNNNITSNVSSNATVTLNTSANTQSVASHVSGAVFSFPVANLSLTSENVYDFDITVNDGTYTYIIAEGIINVS